MKVNLVTVNQAINHTVKPHFTNDYGTNFWVLDLYVIPFFEHLMHAYRGSQYFVVLAEFQNGKHQYILKDKNTNDNISTSKDLGDIKWILEVNDFKDITV